MTIDLNRRDVLQASLAGAVSIAMPAMAQSNFPSRPIKLICPWPAGGSTDGVMRALAESATRILGSPVVIENKAGASGMLGPNELVSAKPDGYTPVPVDHWYFAFATHAKNAIQSFARLYFYCLLNWLHLWHCGAL